VFLLSPLETGPEPAWMRWYNFGSSALCLGPLASDNDYVIPVGLFDGLRITLSGC